MSFNFTSIKDALSMPIDTTCNIIEKVINTGTVETYQNKNKEERHFLPVIIADSETYTVVRIYNMKKAKDCVQQLTYAFLNVIRKPGMQAFWGITSSENIQWTNIEVLQEIIDQAFRNPTTEEVNSHRTLHETLNSSTTSRITGKILQVSIYFYYDTITTHTCTYIHRNLSKTKKLSKPNNTFSPRH